MKREFLKGVKINPDVVIDVLADALEALRNQDAENARERWFAAFRIIDPLVLRREPSACLGNLFEGMEPRYLALFDQCAPPTEGGTMYLRRATQWLMQFERACIMPEIASLAEEVWRRASNPNRYAVDQAEAHVSEHDRELIASVLNANK